MRAKRRKKKRHRKYVHGEHARRKTHQSRKSDRSTHPFRGSFTYEHAPLVP